MPVADGRLARIIVFERFVTCSITNGELPASSPFPILRAEERVLRDPEPVVAVNELADSSVNFVVRPWVGTDDYWDVPWELTEKIKVAFHRHGVSIPFPQMDIRVEKVA